MKNHYLRTSWLKSLNHVCQLSTSFESYLPSHNFNFKYSEFKIKISKFFRFWSLLTSVYSVANSFWPNIGLNSEKNRQFETSKIGSKSAQNRPHFLPILSHFLTPSTLFIVFLCDNFFQSSKLWNNFSKSCSILSKKFR